MQNYTRFVLGTLQYCGWALPAQDKSIYKTSLRFYKLTATGTEECNRVSQLIDVRHDSLKAFAIEERASFTLLTHYLLLERAGYPIDELAPIISKSYESSKPILKVLDIPSREHILYSPIQQADPAEIKAANELDNQIE
ncbi:MAG: hypothetical protein EOP48_25775 [Sphingobacteriales bacterium]|nr:MAG: hypothetical protein EOP48_25775 [Sphingobacteriales bacterium]